MSLLLFAYGSLIFRPGFAFEARTKARAKGFARRFHQGSPDHRGTKDKPGRVVTLAREPSAVCHGVVYSVADELADVVLAELDHRERGGYERVVIDVLAEGAETETRATTWIAEPHNECHLGPAPLDAIVAQVRASVGPSGTNVEYVLRLADALRAMGIDDPHVFAIEAALRS